MTPTASAHHFPDPNANGNAEGNPYDVRYGPVLLDYQRRGQGSNTLIDII